MYIVVTNNVKCRDRYQDKLKVDFLENGSYIDVLIKVRNYIKVIAWKPILWQGA